MMEKPMWHFVLCAVKQTSMEMFECKETMQGNFKYNILHLEYLAYFIRRNYSSIPLQVSDKY